MSIKVVFCDIGSTLIEKRTWIPGAQAFLASTQKAGLKIGLLSNTGNMSRDQLGRLLPDDFDFGAFEESLVLLSSETGVPKPSLAAFSLAVQHSGVSPWECLFVGESLKETFLAQAAGMQSVRVVNSAKDFEFLARQLTSK